MEIGGFQKISLLDYPGKVSSIIFTVGCNFRCPYCYNPSLVNKTCQKIDEELIFEFLRKRGNLLDGVVVTGGEPTIHRDLPDFINRIKNLGFLVNLETNGTNPNMIKEMIFNKEIEYIAMDVKAPLGRYEEIVNVQVNLEKIKESMDIIMESRLEYEFRTTLYPLLTRDDFKKIFPLIKGAKRYVLQQFKNKNTLVKEKLKPYPDEFFSELKKEAENYIKEVEIRK